MPELQKGHVWEDYRHKVQYPVLAEYKIDEIRVHAKIVDADVPHVQFVSYAGKPLHNLLVYSWQMFDLMKAMQVRELDLGFEVNANFNDSYRWVRSSKGLPEDLANADVQFNLYDVPDPEWAFYRTPYIERKHRITDIAYKALSYGIPMYVLQHTYCVDEDQVHEAYARARDAGKEGLMIKTAQHLYQRGKRTKDWLKLKPELDFDGVITGINQAIAEDGTPHNRAGSVNVQCEDGSVAKPHGIPHELGTRMWNHPEEFVGQWCECTAMERDRQGGYRHPVWGRMREAKS